MKTDGIRSRVAWAILLFGFVWIVISALIHPDDIREYIDSLAESEGVSES